MPGNPYNYVAPIADPECFFGRREELERAHEFIGKKACLSFVGEPHSGLTSLLNHLASEPFRERCEATKGPLQFVYVDCRQHAGPVSIIGHMLSEIAPGRPVPQLSNWRSLQSRLIRTLVRPAGEQERRVVVLFDDFEHLGSQQGAVDFLESLRGLAEAEQVVLVTATRTELKNCCHDDVVRSPFCNIFLTEYIGPFTEDEIDQFVRATSARSGVDLLPCLGQLIALAGGHPYFLQIACWHAYEIVARGDQPDQAMAERFLEQVRPDFEGMWRGLDDREQQALRRLSTGSAGGDVPRSLVDRGFVVDGRVFSSAFGYWIGLI